MQAGKFEITDLLTIKSSDFDANTCEILDSYSALRQVFEETKQALGRNMVEYSTVNLSTSSDIIVINNESISRNSTSIQTTF